MQGGNRLSDIILDAREPPIDDNSAVVTLRYLPHYILVRIQREPGHSRRLANLEENVTPILPVTHSLQTEESVNGERLNDESNALNILSPEHTR